MLAVTLALMPPDEDYPIPTGEHEWIAPIPPSWPEHPSVFRTGSFGAELTTVTAFDEDGNRVTLLEQREVRSGWPFAALRWWVNREVNLQSIGPAKTLDSTGIALPTRSVASAQDEWVRIPTVPIVSGLILDVLFWTVVVFSVWSVLIHLRAKRRWRLFRCSRCGHSKSPGQSRCPECGATWVNTVAM